VKNNIAYLADGVYGLAIINVTDPNNPIGLSRFNEEGLVNGLIIEGNYAYLAAYQDGLMVVDISDPTNPTLVGKGPGGGTIMGGVGSGIDYENGYAYITDTYKINVYAPGLPSEEPDPAIPGYSLILIIIASTGLLGIIIIHNKKKLKIK